MSPHYLEKNNKSDAACRTVDHTHNTSAGSCQGRPLSTAEDIIITAVNWTLQ